MDKVKIYVSIINKKVLGILFFIAAITCVDIYSGLKEYSKYVCGNIDIHACDVIFLSVFGINTSDISITDLIRWVIPFIFILYFISLFTSSIFNNKLKFMWIIRCKSYKDRIIEIYKYILFISFVYITFFFISISFFSILLCRNIKKTSDVFLSINVDLQFNSLGIKYIIIQLILSLTSMIIIIMIQNIITFLLKDEIKGEVISIFILLTAGVMGKFDVPNSFMLSKTCLFNNNIDISVIAMLATNIIVFILISYLFIKLNCHSRKEL